MTRYDKIRKAAVEWGGQEYNYADELVDTDKTTGFIAGAIWADAHADQNAKVDDVVIASISSAAIAWYLKHDVKESCIEYVHKTTNH